MVVVVIIGLLAAAALPTYRHITMRSKTTLMENDLRQFTAAIQTFALQNGRWPAHQETLPSVPTDLAGSLPANFTVKTPIGGYYRWNFDTSVGGLPAKAAISIESTSDNPLNDDVALLEMIDKQMDDGSLTSGLIQEAPGMLVFVIEK